MKAKLAVTPQEALEIFNNTKTLPTNTRPVFLYLKEHNVTGLLYFGRTLKNPFKYNGSGKEWKRHIKEHGTDISTIWVRLFENEDDPKLFKMARRISTELDIVNSEKFANKVLENGHVKPKELPSQEYLQECFNYDAETGDLYWKFRPLHHFKMEGTMNSFNKQFATKKIAFVTSEGYIGVKINGKRYHAHRVIWKLCTGKEPSELIDHIDGNPLNNRIENLREASHAENKRNTKVHKNSKTGVKGVKTQGKRYIAEIRHDGKDIYLGSFATLEEARLKHQEASLELHGEFSTVSIEEYKENLKNTKFTIPPSREYPIGVYCKKTSNKLYSVIYHNGKQIYLGSYQTPEEASLAYQKASLEYRGELTGMTMEEYEYLLANTKINVKKPKGVYFKKEYNKYFARINHDKQSYHLGYFNTEAEAADAYNEAALRIRGKI